MSTSRQGITFAEIEQIVTQRVTDAIKAIAVYGAKTRIAHDSMNQVKLDVARACTIGTNEKKAYAGNLPYCNKCKLHHVGTCIVKCGNCKRVGHITRDCKASVVAMNQRSNVANPKAIITCYECRRLGYFRNKCQKLRNQNQVNHIWKGKAHRNSSVDKDKTNA
uniref:Reverse transcriptase domain-containing protein n=1 Tax=Tanacetum cinerariifolium TaxID=118510 RepID=A0A699JGB7_TANCI|nr:reverse transcriptase domain-containing protein [Tanacetum cinerariifolium]